MSYRPYEDIQGDDWEESVLSRALSTPPVSPAQGDRYLIAASATGDWAGFDDHIVEYIGNEWVFKAQSEGQATWIEDENIYVRYDGVAWAVFTGLGAVWGISAGNVYRATGNVGIGTVTPSELLHISGDGSTPQVLIEDLDQLDASGPFNFLKSSGGILSIGTANRLTGSPTGYASLLDLNRNGDSNFSGKLGINKPTPLDTFHVGGSARITNISGGDFLKLESTGTGATTWEQKLDSTGNLNFVNSTEKVSIQTDGKVGIGITTPGALLHVSAAVDEIIRAATDSATGNPKIALFQSTTERAVLQYNHVSTTLDLASDGLITISPNNTVAATFDASGNVGIGVAPLFFLHVKDTVNSTTEMVVESDLGGAHLTLDSGGLATNSADIWIAHAGTTYWRTGIGLDATYTNSYMIWDNAASQVRMSVNGSGYVGIGINDAVRPLHVHSGASGDVRAQFTNITTGATNSDGFAVGIGADEHAFLWQYEALDINFATNNTNRMKLVSDGGLYMIGATGASQGAGTINATGLYVNGVAVSISGHTHVKADITDFVEADYVHLTGTETITGSKTFSANLNMGNNRIVSMADPIDPADAVTLSYFNTYVTTGTKWRNPIVDPDLVGIVSAIPTPATDDTVYIKYGGTQSETWGNVTNVVDGDILLYNTNEAGSWLRLGVLATGDRFIIGGEHGTAEISITSIGFVDNDLIQYNGGTINTAGAWDQPDGDPVTDGVTVLVGNSLSYHFGHSYLYNATGNVWTEVSGPGSINAGNALSWSGNTLNVDDVFVLNTGDTMTGSLIIQNGVSGATAPTTADDLVVENSGDGGISILTPDLNLSRLAFGTPTDNLASQIVWDYTNNQLRIGTARAGASLLLRTADNTDAVIIDSTGQMGIGTTTPDGTLHVLKASAGAITANSNSTLVLENSTTNYLTFLTPNTSVAGLLFGDTESVSVGQLVYDHTLDRMQMVVNSGTRMTIDSSGNVGIGIATPDGRLHVHTATAGVVTANSSADDLVVENSANAGISILTPASTTGHLIFGSPNGPAETQLYYTHGATANTGKLHCQVAGSHAFSIDSSQNVGIGTTGPLTRLHVADSIPALRLSDSDSINATAARGHIEWYHGDNTTRLGQLGYLSSGNVHLYITNNQAGDIIFQTDTTERMRIDSVGNVGIGITNPTYRLYIADDTDSDTRLRVEGGTASTVNTKAILDLTARRTGGFYANSSIECSAVTAANGSELAFITDDSSGASQEAMRIDSSQNVGIGTSSPDELLHIESTSFAPTLKIATSAVQVSVGDIHGQIDFEGRNASSTIYTTARISSVTESSAATRLAGLALSTSGPVPGSLTEKVRITNNGEMGIGTDTPDGTLHVHTATAGVVTANAAGDDLIIENDSHCGISLLSPDANSSLIYFGSPTDAVGALIQYYPATGQFNIGTGNASGYLRFVIADAVEAMRIDNSGNVGIGVTALESWGSSYSVIQLGGNASFMATTAPAASNGLFINQNAYYDGAWKYQITDEASQYYQLGGRHNFRVAASGTADTAITWIDAMRITETGLVGINNISPDAPLYVTGISTVTGKNVATFESVFPSVTVSGTNYWKNIEVWTNDVPIATGITESGYRIGLAIQGYIDSASFQGTLNKQYGLWARVGAFGASPTGTITTSYGVFIDNLETGGVTQTNMYGLYQSNVNATNFFGGYVGIGTSSPDTALHISNAISGHLTLSRVGYDSWAFNINQSGGVDRLSIQNVTTVTEVLSIDAATSNIGLGTASPNQRLQLHEASSIGVWIQITNSTTGSTSTDGLIIGLDSSEQAAFRMREPNPLYFSTNDIERMRIDETGNVGINTATIPNLFTVKGTTSASAINFSNAAGRGGFLTSTSSSQAILGGGVEWVSPNWTARSTTASMVQMSAGVVTFSTDSGLTLDTTYTPTERMRIDDAGNVGIGTTSPVSPLEVRSSVTAGPRNTLVLRNSSEVLSEYVGLRFATGTGSIASTNIVAGVEAQISQATPSLLKGELLFFYNAGDSYLEGMRLSDDGGVYTAGATGGSQGAGTINATGLYVNGVAVATGSSPWTVSGSDIYYNTGNVGIGYSNPSNRLHVHNPSTSSGAIQLTHNGIASPVSNTGIMISLAGSAATIRNYEAGTLGIGSNGSSTLWFDTNQKVGIGTTTPDSKLHVMTASAGTISANANADDFVVENNTFVGMSLISPNTTGANIYFADTDLNTVGRIVYSHASNSLEFWTNNTRSITIDSSQKVGIGATNPDGTLHVHTASAGVVTANTSADDLVVENSTNAGISILSPDASPSYLVFGSPSDTLGAYLTWQQSTTNFIVGTAMAGGDLIFHCDNAVEGMRINSSANVGIGITTPDGKLHVHSASAGTVTADTGADDLVVENSANAGISILSPDASVSQLAFGSPTDAYGAFAKWQHSTKLLKIGTNNATGELSLLTGSEVEALRIASDGGIYTSGATGGSQGADTINASDFFVDGTSIVTFRGALVYNSGAFNFSPSAWRYVTFDSEAYDTDAFHSTSSNTQRFTIPSGVTKVKIKAFARIDSDTTENIDVVMAIVKNYTAGVGTTSLTRTAYRGNGFCDLRNAAVTSFVGPSFYLETAVIDVSTSDTFDLFIYVTSGGGTTYTLTGGTTADYAMWYSIEVIE